MINRHAQPGRVLWIGLRPARRSAMVPVDAASMMTDGLDGDRSRAGKRAVTLVQWEHLAAIGAYLGLEAVMPEILRRNLVISDINLASLKGRAIQVGQAKLRLTAVCAPCSRMEEALGPGGYAAVRGHGGWCAEVLESGPVSLHDPVTPID
ncbi:MAG: MOSC domain-containing protein [Pseudomonadota bacterium]